MPLLSATPYFPASHYSARTACTAHYFLGCSLRWAGANPYSLVPLLLMQIQSVLILNHLTVPQTFVLKCPTIKCSHMRLLHPCVVHRLLTAVLRVGVTDKPVCFTALRCDERGLSLTSSTHYWALWVLLSMCNCLLRYKQLAIVQKSLNSDLAIKQHILYYMY